MVPRSYTVIIDSNILIEVFDLPFHLDLRVTHESILQSITTFYSWRNRNSERLLECPQTFTVGNWHSQDYSQFLYWVILCFVQCMGIAELSPID